MYSYRKFAGWFLIWALPILGPSNFYLFSQSILPLTIYRLGAFVVLGMILRGWKSIIVKPAKVRYSKIYVLFFFILFLLQLSPYPIPTLTTLMPVCFIGITLPFLIIESERDLYKLINIFIWQGAIISLFVIFEFYLDFDIREFLLFDLPEYESRIMYRTGFQRANGLYGNAVFTADYLAFLFPLALLYVRKTKHKTIKYLPIILMIMGLVILQTRAAFVSIIISTVIFFILSISPKKQKQKLTFKVIKRLVIAILFFIPISVYFFPTILDISNVFFKNLLNLITGEGNVPNEIEITDKIQRIPHALAFIKESPIWGHLVSPREAYYNLMDTDDLPAIFLYLIGGGILFGALYLYHLFYMINHLRLLAKKVNISNVNLSSVMSFSYYAILCGTIVTFSNWVESHFLFMYILYFSIMVVLIKHFGAHKTKMPNYRSSSGIGNNSLT